MLIGQVGVSLSVLIGLETLPSVGWPHGHPPHMLIGQLPLTEIVGQMGGYPQLHADWPGGHTPHSPVC